ncbi:MAG: hypothetical protein E7266_00860 [Lachnospiraceae bacterium]|nr:hypothetical protein [Lachnospiraceae bacterium]
MKEVVEKLSRGVIEYERPVLELSESSMEITVDSGEVRKNYFLVKSSNNIPMKCVIYSTNECLRIVDNAFIGTEGRIEYEIDGTMLETGDTINGYINVVSNGGEASIRYEVKVEGKSANTNIGKIKNMFHFANYVQTNYEEALNLFTSKQFVDIFIGRDLKMLSIYEGLMTNKDKAVAMEEFLIASNKKKRVTLSLSEYTKKYDHPYEVFSDSFVVSKDNWGYISCDIVCDSPFIQIDRSVLSSDDFAGSNFEFTYLIRPERLHDGINYGRISIESNNLTNEKIHLDIIVDNTSEEHTLNREYDRCRVELYNVYLDFRTRKIDINQWCRNSLAIIDKMRNMDDTAYFPKLLQAQIYISMKRDADASWLLENIAETLIEKRNREPEAYCYYLYVRTLQKRNPEFTDEMKKKVREYYENGYDKWEILWLLIYMDESYESNISLKLARIKEQYSFGMRSPLMYFEAATVFAYQPMMLRMLNDFEVQTMNFAVKNGLVNEKLAVQYAELAEKEKNITKVIFKTLVRLYEMYRNNAILSAICSILIKKGFVGKEYIKWYRLGIEKELKLAGIYENYLYSLSEDYEEQLPQLVYMYFNYNVDVSNDKLAYLYANIITNKLSAPGIYNTYLKQMEKFAAASLLAGKMNKYFAVIYKDIMSKSFISPEIAEKLPEIICTRLLTCKSEKIKSVRVIHKELIESEEVPVINGKAYVHIYTEEPVLVFEDIYGNKYVEGVKYNLEKLVDMEEYLKMCYEMSAQNLSLNMYFADEYIRYRRNPDKSVAVLQLLIQMDGVREEYKKKIEKEIVEYYKDNYDGDKLDEYLEIVNVEGMDNSLRNQVIELMIVRNHYGRAYELIKKYGYMNIEPRRIMRFVSGVVKEIEFEKIELLVDMAAFAFEKRKYDECILEYLNKYYYGTTTMMLEIWEASNEFAYPVRELEERLLAQMLFTNSFSGKIDKVYSSYYEKGPVEKIKKAYLISKSYDYFVRDVVVAESIFSYIGKELERDEDLTDICKMAYVKYYSEKENPSEEVLENVKRIIEYLCSKNIIFQCYKKYGKYIKLPYIVEDKTILEYKTNPDAKVFVNYVFENGAYEQKSYTVEEMRCVYPGVFIFEATLFYGESLNYYITEQIDDKSMITESQTLVTEGRTIGENPSRYGMLNDLMICQELHEESTVTEISENYLLYKVLTEELFNLL